MRRYNFIQAIYMSFYSRALYRDVANHWGAGVFVYLLFVLVVCWGLMMFSFQPQINSAAQRFSDKYIMQIPEMVVTEGQVSTPEKRPYHIINPQNKKNVAIVDSSGKYTSLYQTPEDTQVLVTKKTVYYYDDHNKLKMQPIPEFLNLHFIPEKVKNFLDGSARWAWIIIFPIFLLISFIYRLIQVLIYGLFGKIFSVILNIRLSYVKIVKLCMVAITPAIIIGDVLNWGGIFFPFQWLLLFFISMLYLVFALKANR